MLFESSRAIAFDFPIARSTSSSTSSSLLMMEASLFILQFDDENDEDEDESLLLSSSTSSRREIAYCSQKRQRRRSKNDDHRRFDMFTILRVCLWVRTNSYIKARRVNLVSTDDTESWGASRIFLEESEYGHLIVNVRKQEIYLHCKLRCEKLNIFS